MNYGYSKEVSYSYDEAIEKVTEALKTQGFGVLTTIDVKDTLKKKLDVDFDRYIILGACNPPFAYEALKAENMVGLLMPCNVVIHEKDGKVRVLFFNPELISFVSENEILKNLSKELSDRISKVMNSV